MIYALQLDWPWILLLLPAPWLIQVMNHGSAESIVPVPPALADELDRLNQARRPRFRPLHMLLWLAWLCLLVSLAQPWVPGDTRIQPVSGRALALAVDVSGSMDRTDFTYQGNPLERLSVVKAMAGDFLDKRQGDRVSLVVYGKDAFIASPLTFDLHAVGSILDSAGIGMAGRSTAIGDAIGLAIQSLQGDPASEKAIILLSDGTNNAGSVEPESAAALAESMGIRIHSIAMGSEDGRLSGFRTAQSADLDEETLRAIAQSSGGQFFRVRDSAELEAVYATIDKLERAEVDAPPVIIRRDLRSYSEALLLLCLLAACFIQWRRR